ncbi:PF12512 family protein [Bordetella bronchiseptica MBORD675]|nr:PF12512 family protein [Bordetella bronchiseptica OSU054]KAK71422.1 PF12512 family protein [Bordetella bronchiseptica MO211]KCV28406.1 PF12512 family protein [Bordetella bronchiseptica 00-P-2730]KCV58601.1 PF12512 family protein [Bordetella bronchiseptica 7E71]KDC16894.1 PF12512 family protein [Bordetella bronchiseptica F-1]KDC32640.1 PF12512 family protein [Bordetella bronchiseptica F2]KDC66583.1 PF12512 family protein [Bordetella bronchiseptica MBORD591]KDC95560.1 PF12512 family protein
MQRIRHSPRWQFWDNATMDTPITLPELEQAINYWRHRVPSQGDESRLCAQAAALATPYALMIIGHRRDITPAELSQAARAAYQAWLDSRK